MNNGNCLNTPGNTVMLHATSEASSRTKNRIRENGCHGFVVVRPPVDSILFSGHKAVLFESIMTKGQDSCKWIGWLPVSEIKASNPQEV